MFSIVRSIGYFDIYLLLNKIWKILQDTLKVDNFLKLSNTVNSIFTVFLKSLKQKNL